MFWRRSAVYRGERLVHLEVAEVFVDEAEPDVSRPEQGVDEAMREARFDAQPVYSLCVRRPCIHDPTHPRGETGPDVRA